MNNLEREKTLQRYLSALDRGDMDAISALLRDAEGDVEFSNMIVDVHRAYEPFDVALNGAKHVGVPRGVVGTHRRAPLREMTRRPQILTLAATLIVVVMFAGLLMLRPTAPSTSGTEPEQYSLDNLQPITTENISELRQLVTLGNGALSGIAWSPDGTTLAVTTSRGIYLHDIANPALPGRPFGGVTDSVGLPVYNPAGTILAALREGTEVRVWDATTGEVLRSIPLPDFRIHELWFSPDNRTLATVGCTAENRNDPPYYCEQFIVRLWDVTTGKETLSIPVDNFYSVVFSPNGSLMGYTDDEFAVLRLVDLATGEEVAEVVPSSSYQTSFNGVFSTDGTKLVLSSPTAGAIIDVYDVHDLLNPPADREPPTLYPRSTASSALIDVQFHPTDDYLLAITSSGALYFCWLDHRTSTHYLPVSGSHVGQMRISPDGKTMATMHYSGMVVLWDISHPSESIDEITRMTNYDPYYSAIVLNADRSRLAAGGYGAAGKWWQLNDPDLPEHKIPTPDSSNVGISDMSFGGLDNLLYVANVTRMTNAAVAALNLETGEYDDLSGIGGYRVFASEDLYMVGGTTAILRWQPGAPEERDWVALRFAGESSTSYSTAPRTASFSPDGRLFAALMCTGTQSLGCEKHEVRLWDTETGKLLLILEIPESKDYFRQGVIAFSPTTPTLAVQICVDELVGTVDGATFYSCNQTAAQLFDFSAALGQIGTPLNYANSLESVPRGEPFAVLQDDGYFPSSSMALSPVTEGNNLLLAIGVYYRSNNATTEFWQINPTTGETTLLHTMDYLGQSMTFSDDGELLAVGGNGVVTLLGVPE